MERIQKILAKTGIASRRKCEELIRQGKVTVNGKTAKIGEKASEKDIIELEGKPIKPEKKKYIMLNKPKGYVTTVKESHGMQTVMELAKVKERVYPVGRLDKNSEGLLLLTNDGETANKLTHPRYDIKKEYEVETDKKINEKTAERIRKGTNIEGRTVQVSKLEVKGKKALIEIHEGRKHIVKRLFAKFGLNVKTLKRTRMGPLQLGELKTGECRELRKSEVYTLKS